MFWAIGKMPARQNIPNRMEIVAVAATKKLAETKRDQFFPDRVVAKLPVSEADRILNSNDKSCLYTEFPAPIMGTVEWDKRTAKPSGKRVTDPDVFLRLL